MNRQQFLHAPLHGINLKQNFKKNGKMSGVERVFVVLFECQ